MSSSTEKRAVTMVEISLDELREGIRREPANLFAVLDACDEPRVPAKVDELGDRAVSLYRGSAERDYWAIAPYLVKVDESLLDWIVENLWDDPWGFFASAPPELASLRTHFRRFLMVQDPDGKEMFFRFYDPRVLPDFLATCTESEAAGFFGPVRQFSLSTEEGKLLVIERDEDNH